MAHTRRSVVARTSSAGNPITQSVTVLPADTVLVLLLKAAGAVVRAGGAPTLDGRAMAQANTQQIAATSPEASAEIWYVLNPLPGTYTLTVPNTGALTCKYTVEAGQAAAGGHTDFEGAAGANATATNPSPGSITVTAAGWIGWAITAGGWTTFSGTPSHTSIAVTDDGADGGGEQYSSNTNPTNGPGTLTFSWAFATSDDWGAVAVAFKEVPASRFNSYTHLTAGAGTSVTTFDTIRVRG